MGTTYLTTRIRRLDKQGAVYTASFLVDSGATETMVDGDRLRSLGIEPEDETVLESLGLVIDPRQERVLRRRGALVKGARGPSIFQEAGGVSRRHSAGMRASLLAWIIAATIGCTRGGAAELMETAKFEELQRNVPHARELYQRIVEQYPESAEATLARERLAALASPAPAN